MPRGARAGRLQLLHDRVGGRARARRRAAIVILSEACASASRWLYRGPARTLDTDGHGARREDLDTTARDASRGVPSGCLKNPSRRSVPVRHVRPVCDELSSERTTARDSPSISPGYLLPRHQRLLERRHVHVVDRPGIPHHPAVVPRVVHRLLLRLELRRAVLRLAEREGLQPRANVLRSR